jgi:DNA-directed RNA polymerase subunit omega
MKKVDSKYALVVAAAKRARMLTEGANPLVEKGNNESLKPVSVALEEIAGGKVLFESTKSGIK